MNRRPLTLGIFAGGIVAAALLSTSAAHADLLDFTLDPDDFTLFGANPATNISTSPFVEILQGPAYLEATDVTKNVGFDMSQFSGSGTETLNPFSQAVEGWNVLVTDIDPEAATLTGISTPFDVDVTEFGSGYANQLVDVYATTAGEMGTITDTLITPFGDFTLFSF